MDQTSRSNAARLQGVWLGCLFAAIAYAIYASITRTGIAGYAMKVQMDLWQTASEGTTFMLTVGAVVAGFFVISAILERVFPSLRGMRAQAVRQADRPLGTLSWKWVAVISVAPILVGGLISASWYRSEREDANAPVYPIDLRSAPSAPPKDARFVEVTGAIDRAHLVVYKKTEDQKVTHEVFAPLVAGTGQAPIRYVVHTEASESYDGHVKWPDIFRQPGTAPFSGRIGRSLPAFAVSSLRAKGAVLDSSYSVIEWKDLRYRKVGEAAADNPWFVPLAIGGFLGVVLLPMMLVVKFKLGRMARKTQVA